MPPRSSGGSLGDGSIFHFHATRIRVVGSGILRQTLNSFDDVNQETLPELTMAAATNREPTTLANFKDQNGQLIITTTNIDEYFVINKIIVFIRPVATGYPQ